MHQLATRVLTVVALAIGVVIPCVPIAQGQEHCVPFGGTTHGWLSDHWQGVGDFTVGRKVWHANVKVNTLSVVDGGDTWTGIEAIAFDFGKGNILRFSGGEFVTEHMTDPGSTGGVFHIIEAGRVANGKGIFQHVYGHWTMQGPFGPGLKLPDSIQHPPADWFWIGQYHGTICGIEG